MPGVQRGLLLDLDGTLAQSVGLLEGIYFRFLETRGQKGSSAEFSRLNGPSLSAVVGDLKQKYGFTAPLEQLQREYLEDIRARYNTVVPSPGAFELVTAAVHAGWRVEIVTSNTLEITAGWLRHVGLSDRIHAVTTSEMVTRGKPEPDIYLRALADCECLDVNACAVEDTLAGAVSATGAGIKTYLIGCDNELSGSLPAGIVSIRRLADVIPLVGL